MTNNGQETKSISVGTKHGMQVYDRNPSVPAPGQLPITKRSVKVANGNRALIIGEDTGEILGEGHAAFFELQEVDKAQFIKLYIGGIQNLNKLSAAGYQVFEMVYNQMRENPQSDKIELNFYLAEKYGLKLSDRTFRRGLRELLTYEYLYRSTSADVYFVNIKFMFNGSRVTLAKSYYLRDKSGQGQLPLDVVPPTLPAAENPE